MENKNLHFDFDDILIVPSKKTDINSRYKNIYLDRKLPLFTAPMDTVVDLDNMKTFINNGIGVTLPRTIKLKDFLNHNKKFKQYNNSNIFISLGFEDLDFFGKQRYNAFNIGQHILIDVANGHLQKIIDYAKDIKKYRPDIIIMVGNIGNPETYKWYAENDCVDYIRVGIGNGCFVAGSKVKTKIGTENIEDIRVGDEVLTHSGEYKLVVSTKKRDHYGDLMKINNIVCTPNHEFCVLNKKHQHTINDENMMDLCEWISVKELSESNQYLLIEIDNDYENDIEI